MPENLKRDGVNDGTKVKATLQLRAIDFLKGYGDKKTLESYARLLCWDINISYRTALESYIMPLFERDYFVYEGDNKYSFKNGKENKQIKKGRITKDTVENKESATDYMQKHPNETEKLSKDNPLREKLKSD